MALLFMDSFDHYVTADLLKKWSSQTINSGSTIVIHPTAGRRGSQGLRMVTPIYGFAPHNVSKNIASSSTTGICGFSFVTATSPVTTTRGFASLKAVSGGQITLGLTTTMLVGIWRGDSPTGTLLGMSSAAISTGVPTYIEVKVTWHGSAGTLDLWFNGSSVLSLTGVNIVSPQAFTSVIFGQVSGSLTNDLVHTWDYDDVYIADGAGAAPWNDALGDVRVDARRPTAPGVSSQWTPSTGANWECVDDVLADDADYNLAVAPGPKVDLYTVQDVGAPILGVQPVWRAKKMDSGLCAIAPVIRQGTNWTGTSQSPGTDYLYQMQALGANPHTGVAWTEADFNADEFGLVRA